MECVINVVNHDILHQMNLASCEYGDGVNEFDKSGLTAIESEAVKPFRVKESPAQFECKVREIIHLGEEGGAGNLVVAEVVRMHFHDETFGEDGNLDPQKLDLVSRMGQNWYSRAHGDAVFEVPKPGRAVGIGVDSIPDAIRTSSILTGNDLGQLGMCPELPSESDVLAYAAESKAKGLLSEYERNPEQAERLIHKEAQKLIASGNIQEAWKLLLTTTNA